MKRRREKLHSRRQRPVLSDTLPFELPASFGNRHFFDVLSAYDVQIFQNKLRWECATDEIDEAIYVISGIPRDNPVVTSQETLFGKVRLYRHLVISDNDFVKTPFQFQISHRDNDSRTLSIPHPLNQIAVANFYNDHADSIIYYTGRSPFSIRRPESVARFSNFRDRMHERLLARQDNFEESGREYDQIGSFFVYKIVNNVFKFFESYRYHRAEKRFDAMLQIDISKCFDSIYTHSLPWAVHGKRPIKDDLPSSKSTFSAKFDKLMQSTNHAETNGIIIGPEFSRIFAEMILQSVDVEIEKSLRSIHGILHRKDYEIFRYVDDYFIFFNKTVDSALIVDTVEHHLGMMKLHVNKDKTKLYEKPVITEITIAKSAIGSLLSDGISSRCDIVGDDSIGEVGELLQFTASAKSRSLIIGYKTILKTASVSYAEVGNYTFSLIESAVDRVLADYIRCAPELRSTSLLTDVLTNVFEFSFFVYAAAPRVNLSIRLTRLVSVVARALRKLRFPQDFRHHVFKYIHDNVVHQLTKNQVSEYKEVESLYLISSLGELGREYWLDQDYLCQHLKIIKIKDGTFFRQKRLNHLVITVTLQYIKNRSKYNKLRDFLISEILNKIETDKPYKSTDTEILILFLDAVTCPYISNETKITLAGHFGLNTAQYEKLAGVSENWFTTWKGFNLSKELDAKRYREVY